MCRSVESNTVPTIIDAANQSNITIENMVLSNSTEPTPRTFDICEYFVDQNELNTLKWLRQVTLLSKLEARFHNADHKNVRFIIVTKNETNGARIRNASRQLEVVVLNNTRNSQYSLLEDRSVYIFDDCGRIVYVIHYPFSSVQKPFVKAAILSTIYDQPCGSCTLTGDFDDSFEDSSIFETESDTTTTELPEAYAQTTTLQQLDPLVTVQMTSFEFDTQIPSTDSPNIVDAIVRNENEIVKFSPPISTSILDNNTDAESSSYASYVVPLKIILPVEHVHRSIKNDSFERFNYILLKVDDASYHEHINSDNSDFLLPVEPVNRNISPTDSVKTVSESEYNADTTPNMINVVEPDRKIDFNTGQYIQRDDSDAILVDADGYKYELAKHYEIVNEQGESVGEFDEIAMLRSDDSDRPHNQISKRILVDEQIKPTTESTENANSDQYEAHYAKIFQWIHYHL
ncbi:uncharacterized protein LOC116337615 [Contarinia nasturtii]|uniref:uncharacterized protein LOC116337615 n=1 Tax=Contarinia nasturtii TaxID=265458 RepID=UPI0012D3DECC|nr:uncharacterized protein LOC116337615 [Contarinia nasturtii]